MPRRKKFSPVPDMPPEEIERTIQENPYMTDQYPFDMIPSTPPPHIEADIIEKTDPKALMDKLERTFAGEEYDEEYKVWRRKRKPMMNKTGIKSIMADVRAVVNQNTILSNLNEREIGVIMIQLGDTVLMKLAQERDNFEITKPELNTIVDAVVHTAYPCLKRAWQQGERNWHKTVTRSEIIQRIQNPPMQREEGKRGFFGRLFR